VGGDIFVGDHWRRNIVKGGAEVRDWRSHQRLKPTQIEIRENVRRDQEQ
jgi:hypothetical protein